jgi:MFS family permease
MLSPLRNRTYRHLFAAQVVSLIGSGLMTVALGLLAYQLADKDAGAVLGTALAIKMIAYVGVAPIAAAVAQAVPRRALLAVLDLVRAAMALTLPFVDQIWQIYLLIFLLQSASAAFTPAFQATIPDILDDEAEYTKALSLSRLAYDLESVFSPMLAAALLTLISFHDLFAGTAFGFLASAALVVSVTLPAAKQSAAQSFAQRLTRGVRIFLAKPRLRGLLALNLSAAAGGAIVFVNTVVIVKGILAYGDREVAVTLGAFGAGSMTAALFLPAVLDRVSDRRVMAWGAGGMAVPLIFAALAIATLSPNALWPALLAAWFTLGLCYGALITPSGRLLRKSATESDRPALFAAQFALSHACWLITYPLAGRAGAVLGMPMIITVHAALTLAAVILALRLWPAADPEILEHEHRDLPAGHPHLRDHPGTGASHAHRFAVDELQPTRPSK